MSPYGISSRSKQVCVIAVIMSVPLHVILIDGATLNFLMESIKTAQTIKGDPFN